MALDHPTWIPATLGAIEATVFEEEVGSVKGERCKR
jgi:hypothetical protein